MRGKFKKCPFCGSKAEIRDVYDVVDWTEDDEPVTKRRFVCECKGDECWVNPVTDAFDTEEEAIEAWNRRSEGAIKALGQESILDKIKNEIKDNTYFINETTEKEGIDFETVEKIIDKYKTESEVENEN